MKYFIIAGEPSGDLHGSNLMKAILNIDTNAEFRYWGGKNMEAVANGKILDIAQTSIMGFLEVAVNIRKIKHFFVLTKRAIVDFDPDVVIFIDYPGFNLRMAKWAKSKNFKTVFYISPQLWAWKKGRKESIKKYIDELIVILPFEKKWYAKHNINAKYVGHPLLEAIKQYHFKNIKSAKPSIALLPGSRLQEVKKILPVMLQAAENYNVEYDIIIAGTHHIGSETYKELMDKSTVELVMDKTYDVVKSAKIALVASGTATLETALIGTPQVVCYMTANINYTIGRHLVDLKYISLVNLILDEPAVPELIQHDLNKDKLTKTIKSVLEQVDDIKTKYRILHSLLDKGVPASYLAAEIIKNLTKSKI